MPHNGRCGKPDNIGLNGQGRSGYLIAAQQTKAHNRRKKSGKSDLPRKEEKASLLELEAGWERP